MHTALQNLDAELGVLGAVLYDANAIDHFPDLRPEHFAEPLHGRIYEVLLAKAKAKETAEPSGLASFFSTDPAFVDPANPTLKPNIARFFADLLDSGPPAKVAEAMAQTVMDAAQRRILIELSARLRDGAHDPTIPAFDTLSQGEVALSAMIQAAAPAGHTLISAVDAARGTVARLRYERDTGKTKGHMTGLKCFDVRLRGIQPSHLIVIGGRPSMGKTSLARAAAIGCARRNPDKVVVYFCVEMDREEMSLRTLSQLTREHGKGIPYFDMEGTELSSNQLDLLDQLAEEVPPNFILDDSSSISIDHIIRRLYSLRQQGKEIAAVFVDYIQIMEMPRGFNSSRNEAVGEITSTFKRLAKSLQCGFVALSQLSRQVENRDDKRPQLADLRDSGSVEQDANVVMFPYREAYYLERQGLPKDMDPLAYEDRLQSMKGKMEVMTAKFRGGAIGSDMQRYSPAFDLIVNEDEEITPWVFSA